MSRSCEVHADGSGAIVVRRASGADDVAHLLAVADRLGAAAHPGVVPVISSHGDAEHWELRLAFAGQPVEQLGALPVEQVAGLAASVAATLADLHAVGVVHGRIDGSHVLIGPRGRPILCGFAPLDGDGSRPEHDVAGVGALIVALLGTDSDVEPIPDRRWSRRVQWKGWGRRSLLLVADQAAAEPPTRRPTAARLAAAIADAVPGASLIDLPERGSEPDATSGAPTDPTAERASLGLPALVGALGFVLLLAVVAARTAPRLLQRSHAPAATSTTMIALPTTTSPTVARGQGCTQLRSAPGCGDDIAVDGTLVTVGARRYQVGEPGDLVVVGDWNGDGLRTAAVLRPSTGAVFVFSAWTDAAEITEPAMDLISDAVALIVEHDEAADRLVVRRGDGTQVIVPIEEAA